VFGGGDWEQQRVMTSTGNFGLQVPNFIDGINRSFDESTRQTVNYTSNFSSFELNYHVQQRLRRDRLIMDANGHWHRAANSGFEREYLAGLRFMELGDTLDWRAEDIEVIGDDGQYFIRTDNDLFGFQMGVGETYQSSRWSVGVIAKGGVYVNDAHGHIILSFTADDLNDAELQLAEDELSFVGETTVIGRWHLSPNVSLRAAYELMYVTSLALAPNQATFLPTISYLNTTQDPFYHGASFGIEGYW
jgi:hypothetical protein